MKKLQRDNLIKKLVLPLGSSLAAYLVFENKYPQVVTYKLTSKKIKKPQNIVVLADLHNKTFGKDNSRILKEIVKIKPNLILVPGDTISSKDKNVEPAMKLISVLSKMCQVVMILGNHEQRRVDTDDIVYEYRKNGAQVLINDETQAGEVRILGMCENLAVSRTDYIKKAVGVLKYENHDKMLSDFAQKDGYKIVLSHFPELFSQSGKTRYSKFDFDLMISGHAHGGHWNIPFVGPIFSFGQGFFPKNSGGIYEHNPSLIVSRGLGNDGPVPRVNNRPEITNIVIEPC